MTHEKKKKKMKIEKNCLLTRADRISLEFFIVFCDTRKDFSNFSGSLFLFFFSLFSSRFTPNYKMIAIFQLREG